MPSRAGIAGESGWAAWVVVGGWGVRLGLMASPSVLCPSRLPQLGVAIGLVSEISQQLVERKNDAVSEIGSSFAELEKALQQRKGLLVRDLEALCGAKQKVRSPEGWSRLSAPAPPLPRPDLIWKVRRLGSAPGSGQMGISGPLFLIAFGGLLSCLWFRLATVANTDFWTFLCEFI